MLTAFGLIGASRLGLGVPDNGLLFYVDAANPSSYPGTGTTWYNISPTNPTTGSLINGASYSSIGGGSIYFDGSNDYAEFSRVLNGQTQLSIIGFWYKESTSTYYGGWLSQNTRGYPSSPGDMSIYGGDDTGILGINGVSGDTRYGVTSGGAWKMHSAILNSVNVNQYDNLTLVKQNGYTPSTQGTNNTLRLGQAGGYPGFYAPGYGQGKLAAVLVYNRAITSDEMTTIYNKYKSRLGLP